MAWRAAWSALAVPEQVLTTTMSAVGPSTGGGPAEGSRVHLGPIGAAANHGMSAYVGLRGLRSPTGETKPFNGVAYTGDGGRTWSIVHRESDRPAANFSTS